MLVLLELLQVLFTVLLPVLMRLDDCSSVLQADEFTFPTLIKTLAYTGRVDEALQVCCSSSAPDCCAALPLCS